MMEKNEDVYLAAGKLIVFSSGSYSDYGYHGMYVTLRPLLRSQLAEIAADTDAEYKRLHKQKDMERAIWRALPADQRDGEVPWAPGLHELWETNLIKAGLLMIIDYTEMHVGDYGELNLQW